MSTTAKKFPRLLILCAEILLLVAACSAQDFEATIKLILPATVRIEGKFLRENVIQSNKNWHLQVQLEISKILVKEFQISN